MAQTLQFEKSYQNVLIPAEPGTSEYLQLIPVGQLLCGEFRKPRNYAFHKKFFASDPRVSLLDAFRWSH